MNNSFRFTQNDAVENSFLLSGLFLLDESGTFQQATFRIFHTHHTERPLPSKSNGRHCVNNGLELRVHHIRRKQLRYKGESRVNNYSILLEKFGSVCICSKAFSESV